MRQLKTAMKLAAFITTNIEHILSEWDVFAKTLFPVSLHASPLLLRDHAREVLQELTQDIETGQSAQQQIDKSKSEPSDVDMKSAASEHGTQREASGFTLIQLTSEYRSFRATVFRLWMPSMEPTTQDVLEDIMRFNEAIDQALAESVVTYSENADRTRDTFLAILGHDLRSPLFTMTMAGNYFTRLETGIAGAHEMGSRVSRSAASMTAMVNDLLEYARTQLGGTIPLSPARVNVHDICYAAMQDAQAGHPECPFALQASGDTTGLFDGPRLQQVFSNLLNNAAQYRAETHPVTITARGDADNVVVHVCNMGPVIPAQSLKAIFDPMVQLTMMDEGQAGAPASSLGLGLFIAREITAAHGGSIKAESSAQSGTFFVVSLPKKGPAAEKNAGWNRRKSDEK